MGVHNDVTLLTTKFSQKKKTLWYVLWRSGDLFETAPEWASNGLQRTCQNGEESDGTRVIENPAFNWFIVMSWLWIMEWRFRKTSHATPHLTIVQLEVYCTYQWGSTRLWAGTFTVSRILWRLQAFGVCWFARQICTFSGHLCVRQIFSTFRCFAWLGSSVYTKMFCLDKDFLSNSICSSAYLWGVIVDFCCHTYLPIHWFYLAPYFVITFF